VPKLRAPLLTSLVAEVSRRLGTKLLRKPNSKLISKLLSELA
jgi:hypothetical protein